MPRPRPNFCSGMGQLGAWPIGTPFCSSPAASPATYMSLCASSCMHAYMYVCANVVGQVPTASRGGAQQAHHHRWLGPPLRAAREVRLAAPRLVEQQGLVVVCSACCWGGGFPSCQADAAAALGGRTRETPLWRVYVGEFMLQVHRCWAVLHGSDTHTRACVLLQLAASLRASSSVPLPWCVSIPVCPIS